MDDPSPFKTDRTGSFSLLPLYRITQTQDGLLPCFR